MLKLVPPFKSPQHVLQFIAIFKMIENENIHHRGAERQKERLFREGGGRGKKGGGKGGLGECLNVLTPFDRGTRRLFSVNICSKKQILPRNFDSSRKAKNF